MPYDYYYATAKDEDHKLEDYLALILSEGERIVAEKMLLLERQVSREDFDRIFDAHWHAAVLIRHLIYETATGGVEEDAVDIRLTVSTPAKIIKNGPSGAYDDSASPPKSVLARRLAGMESSSGDEGGEENYTTEN